MSNEITMANIEQFVGKTVDSARRMWHNYPLTIKKSDGQYFYVDRTGTAIHFNDKDSISFDRVMEETEKGGQTAMNDKTISFIDTQYNTLFTIPDGGSIVVTRPSGEQYVGVCKYLDETHFEVSGGSCYHIMQFAEIQERNGAAVEPEKEPEMVGGRYRVTHRIPVGDKIYVLGHSPKAPQPYATWQAYRDTPGKDYGHYWTKYSDAWGDLLCRADAERTGKPYDHTKRYQQKNRDDAR